MHGTCRRHIHQDACMVVWDGRLASVFPFPPTCMLLQHRYDFVVHGCMHGYHVLGFVQPRLVSTQRTKGPWPTCSALRRGREGAMAMRRSMLHLLAALLMHVACGMRVEDAGRWDWQRKGMAGPAKRSVPQCGQNLQLVVDGKGAVVALHPHDGERMWRRAGDVAAEDLWMVEEERVVVSYPDGRVLRAWDAKRGGLIWERYFMEDEDATNLVLAGEHILVDVQGKEEKRIRVRDGHVMEDDAEFEKERSEDLRSTNTAVSVQTEVVQGKLWLQVKDQSGVRKAWMEEGLSHGNVVRADACACTDGDRVLLSMEDHALLMVEIPRETNKAVVKWTREDALASIQQVLFAELPDSEAPLEGDASLGAVTPVAIGWKETLRMQLLKAKTQLGLQQPQELEELKHLEESTSDKNRLSRDHNGFRKILLVLTEPGKVYALHNGDGRILWSTFLPGKWKQMFHLTTPHLTDSPPECILFGATDSGTTTATALSTYSGKVVSTTPLTYSLEQVFALPSYHEAYRYTFMIVDERETAHLFPETKEALAALHNLEQDIHFFSADLAGNTLHGFGVQALKNTYSFQSLELWRHVVPKTERILSVASRMPEDKVYTQIKVLGDRRILYKYVNPNTLFLVTGDAHAGEDAGLTCSVIDSVSGTVLHHEHLKNALGPVSSVMSENWIVFSYVDAASRKDVLSVLELYERPRHEQLSTGELLKRKFLGRDLLHSNYSSFNLPKVRVMGKSFFSPVGVKKLGVTLSHRGIASKDVLLLTHFDQILAMPKKLLDPRRPDGKPNADEKEEMLMQYSAALPFMPQKFATYSHVVSDLEDVVVSPTFLESTSLFFAYGTDLFFGRLTPSNTFDRLGENFSHVFLLFTVLGLVGGTSLLGQVLKGRELAAKWA